MTRKGLFLAFALTMAVVAPVCAQITANALPPLEGLPAVWTPAAPVFPVPSQWAATVDYTATNPQPGVWTYWYRIQHAGGAVLPLQVLKSSTLNLDPAFVQMVGPTLQFGQFDPGVGQSWAAEALFPGDSTLRWSFSAVPGLNALSPGETIYLWVRSPFGPGPMVNLTLQDGSIAQTKVLGPPVPEPVSLALVGIGLSAVAALRRKTV